MRGWLTEVEANNNTARWEESEERNYILYQNWLVKGVKIHILNPLTLLE